jgi:hypothetical protein
VHQEAPLPHRRSFFQRHSLSIVSILFLIAWIVLYMLSSEKTHLGSFFGNAIADWSGVVVTVLATKYLYEKGSVESRQPHDEQLGGMRKILVDHSLSIFLVLTGAAWITLYAVMDSESKWGQVIGNIVSEWTQIFALVILTKRLIEPHSKESKK